MRNQAGIIDGGYLRWHHVSHLLADLEHAEQMAFKIEDVIIGVAVEMELDGYRLDRISRSARGARVQRRGDAVTPR